MDNRSPVIVLNSRLSLVEELGSLGKKMHLSLLCQKETEKKGIIVRCIHTYRFRTAFTFS